MQRRKYKDCFDLRSRSQKGVMEKPKRKQVLLFHCVESEDLARKVAAQSDSIQLQSINWRSFDDGFPNLFINNAHNIRGHHVAFLASFSSPGVIFEQLSVIFALPRLFVASFTLVLPFFPTGSFERMEEEGDVATAFTMARILSNIPISRGGPTSLVIYDIHALQDLFFLLKLSRKPVKKFDAQLVWRGGSCDWPASNAFSLPEVYGELDSWRIIAEGEASFSRYACASTGALDSDLRIFIVDFTQERFYFGDHVLPCFETGIPLLKQRLHQLPDADNIVIAFPDDGAWKRFYKQLQHFPMVVCAKVREGDKRIVRLKEGNPAGCHVVIVDDLVQSGGTLIECQKVLAAHGATKVSAYVTHGVFPKRSWERFTHKNDEDSQKAFAYFWITDSCPLTVTAIANKAPFEVLSLAGSIADALQI
ncbi:hypothetical protein HHK36_003536 [Tetracentron sinense]|uniref:ribose-phosphate diphosphokinase n=1 Tax=Tetracentron sinense TaxID=13715 RepID=A0A834ZRC0_TETSI|nr:hypothetical protein HHK36_003536 [Tetracentron sinense]